MPSSNVNLPLFVDLDGTLIKSDVSYESSLALIKKNPLYIFCIFFWLLKGRPHLKSKISEIVELDAKHVPYNVEFVKFLHSEKELGRKIILASASDKKFVEHMAKESHLFADVIATDNGENLSGKNKAVAILDYCKRNNLPAEYAYAGNSPVDIAVWKEAKESILVTDDKLFAKSVSKVISFSNTFIYGGQIKAILKGIRIHQWSKNVLLFIPIVMAHRLLDTEALERVVYAFFAFSFAASAIYLVNDLLDIEADRAHRTKKHRPLASGTMQIRTALLLIPLLLGLSLLISLNLPTNFGLCMLLYLFSTSAYSFYLKRVPVLDIIVLAMLYVLRLFAGSMSSGVFISQWMLSFSLFAFTSLACLKRFSELSLVKSEDSKKTLGRGYQVSDIEPISQFGTASAYLAVFVLVFYINSKEVLGLYRHPEVMWLICPIILYWTTRIWIYAYRGLVHDDPVVFALRDKVSYLVGAIVAGLLMTAM